MPLVVAYSVKILDKTFLTGILVAYLSLARSWVFFVQRFSQAEKKSGSKFSIVK